MQHIECTLARTRFDFKELHCYEAVAHSVRDRLIEKFNDTNFLFNKAGAKRLSYMSLEFLMGRALQNALINIALEENYREAVEELGYVLERIYEEEVDPALGNGGLGRLAACFLDSFATLNYNAWGYGLRYEYGIFRQVIRDGYQVEVPDMWLSLTNPWEIERMDIQYAVRFYGSTRVVYQGARELHLWEGGEVVFARAFDTPIPGYCTDNTVGLRLWKSLPAREFDLTSFNTGDYFKALYERQKASEITSVLYPNDSTAQGKELRLKQEYLLVSATVQDVFRRFKRSQLAEKKEIAWESFPDSCVMQLNDTHPVLAIVELLRILIDVEKLDDKEAWLIVTRVFGYTNHTVLPEALEKWSVDMLGHLLPRHLEIIYLINFNWLQKVERKYPGNTDKLRSLSIIQEEPKMVRMAHLGIVGSAVVNGVAAIHSQLIKTDLFRDFAEFFPHKFQNKTNGVTPRRWILCANPQLAALYTASLASDRWVVDMDELRGLEKLAKQPEFQGKWACIKHSNKLRLARYVKDALGVELNPDSLFDIQIKRIHEYKRQLMNILYAVHRYLALKAMTPAQRKQVVPRSVLFGGKSAPGYLTAKKIIKLINSVAEVVNNDFETSDYLKVVFVPNYGVSNAQILIPAAELSEHISTAGLEASGTSNMKFTMNGCVLIGTLDGANVEIREEVGAENFFLFGARVEDIAALRRRMQEMPPEEYWGAKLTRVFRSIEEGVFGSREVLTECINVIRWRNDHYLVCTDFEDYVRAQQEVDEAYTNKARWN